MVPLERRAEPLVLPFDRAAFARDPRHATVAYVGIVDAPPGASRTCPEPDGSITLETAIRGRVSSVRPEEIVVERGGFRSILRHFLPDAIDLSPLLGTEVRIETNERLHDGRCTVDATLRDRDGELVLRAHDGELPEDGRAHGLALRMCMSEVSRGLAVAHRSGLAMLRTRGIAEVENDAGNLLLLALRTDADDIAFVTLRQ